MSDCLHRLVLSADDARRVALVWAVESVDPRGRLLDSAARHTATRRAQAAGGAEPRRWLPLRARTLAEQLVGPAGPLPEGLMRWTDPVRGLALPLAAVALVVGLATNALGGDRRIHVLALPLLGVLAWNVTMLLLLLARRIVPFPGRSALGRALAGMRDRAGRKLLERGLRRVEADARPTTEEAPPRLRAITRFLGLWSPASAPLALARAERALHGAALAMAAGVIGGMYLRGLGFAYQATWESTFLGAEAVQGLLDTILAPASALTGIAVPSVAAIEAPAGGAAAPWIHLWAATAAWLVGAPRLLLLGLAAARCARRRARLELDLPAAYLRRLISAVDPQARRIEVLAFSYRPAAATAEALKRVLLDLFGARAAVRTVMLDYGDEPPSADGEARCRVLLMSLAQTPEAEVHGELIQSAASDLLDGQSLLVVVDASAYRQRLGTGAEQRLAERRRAWERLLAETPVAGCFVDLGSAEDPGPRMLEHAFPPGSLDDLRRLA